jgi:sulfate transport system ATP-binding protein
MITIRSISKSFGTYRALDDINLEIAKGELLALLGPSGCGKTTLLRIIAGLETVDNGTILFDNEDIAGLLPQKRRIGFVFQHFALFKHMTVFDNIAFGLTARPARSRPSKQEIAKRVKDLLKLIQMEWLADSFPGKLSGGQRQRVALARALAIEPSVLLLDEPFGALDATVRRELRRWLKRLHDDLHITSIFVTHDQEEALEVANRVVVMNKGKIEQIGSPEEVYSRPANRFVYQFLGDVNVFKGRLKEGSFDYSGNRNTAPLSAAADVTEAIGCIRPDEIEIVVSPAPGLIAAHVGTVRPAGPVVRVELKRDDDGALVLAELRRNAFAALGIRPDDQVYLNFASMKTFVDEGAYI